MSTRGVFVFADNPAATFESRAAHCVYVHYDTYPAGAAAYLAACLASRMTWPAPRFEADEFAAGFVASIKAAMREQADARAAERAASGQAPAPWDVGAGGNVRLMHRWDEAGDIAWAYLVTPAKGRELAITAAQTRWQEGEAGEEWLALEPPAYSGSLAGFLANYGKREEAATPGGAS